MASIEGTLSVGCHLTLAAVTGFYVLTDPLGLGALIMLVFAATNAVLKAAKLAGKRGA